MLTMSAKFRSIVEDTGQKLETFAWDDPNFYATWVAQQYFLVRHTTRFICLAAARTELGERDDHYHFVHHLKEEMHHDLPLLKDLKALGREISQFEEFPETRLIVHNQYYWLEQGKVSALSGYALMLEALSVRNIPGMIAAVTSAGHEKATAFLKLHYEVDQEHATEGFAAIEKLDPKLHLDVINNLEESSLLYVGMLNRCHAKTRGNFNVLPQGRKIAA